MTDVDRIELLLPHLSDDGYQRGLNHASRCPGPSRAVLTEFVIYVRDRNV